MEEILQLINDDEELSPEEIIKLFNYVGESGAVILLKNDGIRSDNKFTVAISNAGEAIRIDAATLSIALKKSLKEYISQTKG